MNSTGKSIIYILVVLLSATVTPGFGEDSKPVGLIQNSEKAFDGYTLYGPIHGTTTYLIDMEGRVVNSWESEYRPGQSFYLLENGHLLRTACPGRDHNPTFHGGGMGGMMQEFNWDGELVWEFEYSSEDHLLHHDMERLPNGNILMLAWEKKSPKEAYDAGRNHERIGEEGLWPDCIIEVKPKGIKGGEIVWEWHAWDHLIQEIDRKRDNYGKVAEHPERININPKDWESKLSKDEEAKLRALGYLAGPKRDKNRGESPDFMHSNAIDYNPKLDQIVISVLGFNEIWIIDHSTTTKEAAGHEGGRYGKGGDLLYRWGNPKACGLGSPEDQQLFAQHDAQWIFDDESSAGHLLIFNNGRGRPGGSYSSVDEIVPPIDAKGFYKRAKNAAFGPDKPVWSYCAEEPEDFYSGHISGAQRLKNGNTLICSGEQGDFFEVTTDGEKVWRYINPIKGSPQRPPMGFRGKGAARMKPGQGEDGDPDDRQRRRPKDNKRPNRSPDMGGPPGMGGPDKKGKDENEVFRVYRYAADYPGLKGKKLTPGKTVEALQKAKSKVDNN